MADYINNVAAADKYTDACTLGPDFQGRRAVITIANNAALMQFAVGRLGDWRWSDEREFFSIPQSFQVDGIIGLRVRNATPGQVARVLAVLSGPDDIEITSGQPFTGTLSASGQVAGLSGDYSVIQKTELSAPATSFIFLGIPAGFSSLVLALVGRGDAAVLNTAVQVQFNGDAGANYDFQQIFAGGGAAPGQSAVAGAASLQIGSVPGALAPAGVFGQNDITIDRYADTDKIKSLTSLQALKQGNTANDLFIVQSIGFWRSLLALSNMNIFCNAGGSFVAGSSAILYGRT